MWSTAVSRILRTSAFFSLPPEVAAILSAIISTVKTFLFFSSSRITSDPNARRQELAAVPAGAAVRPPWRATPRRARRPVCTLIMTRRGPDAAFASQKESKHALDGMRLAPFCSLAGLLDFPADAQEMRCRGRSGRDGVDRPTFDFPRPSRGRPPPGETSAGPWPPISRGPTQDFVKSLQATGNVIVSLCHTDATV